MGDAVFDELFFGPSKGAFVEHGLYERAFPGLVVLLVKQENLASALYRRLSILGAFPSDWSPVVFVIRHFDVLVHFREPPVEAHLHGGDGHAVQVVDVVEHGVFTEGFQQGVLDSGHVEGGDHGVEPSELVVHPDPEPGDTGGFPVLVDAVDYVTTRSPQVCLDVSVPQVLDDKVV